MDFMRGRYREDPEINLIPMIDVLLVILIFLLVTTTFSQLAELKVNLPEASAEKPAEKVDTLQVVVDAGGRYLINGTPTTFTTPDQLALELKRAAGNKADPVVTISADAKATHQSVINIMESARLAGYSRISFVTEARGGK